MERNLHVFKKAVEPLIANITKEARGKNDMDIIWKEKACLCKHCQRICIIRWKGEKSWQGWGFHMNQQNGEYCKCDSMFYMNW